MTPEIRRAALRMAAKTALVVTVGCGGQPVAPPHDLAASPAESCSAYLGALATVERTEVKADDPIRARIEDGLAIYILFADATQRTAPRTLACCSDVLTVGPSVQRGACCSAVDDGAHHSTGSYFGGRTDAERAACAPWGPPCPPEMS